MEKFIVELDFQPIESTLTLDRPTSSCLQDDAYVINETDVMTRQEAMEPSNQRGYIIHPYV